MEMNLKQLEEDLKGYEAHARFGENTDYQKAVEIIQDIINNYTEEEASEILNRVAWMVRRETTRIYYEKCLKKLQEE